MLVCARCYSFIPISGLHTRELKLTSHLVGKLVRALVDGLVDSLAYGLTYKPVDEPTHVSV